MIKNRLLTDEEKKKFKDLLKKGKLTMGMFCTSHGYNYETIAQYVRNTDSRKLNKSSDFYNTLIKIGVINEKIKKVKA